MTEQTALLLGRGIYDLNELARLTGRSPDEVSGWALPATAGRHQREALLLPAEGRLFSFLDLVTAIVCAELRGRGVPLGKVRDAREHLADRLHVDRPFAHKEGLRRLATVGRDVYFYEDSDWVDAGKGGQAAFKIVVAPLIRRLKFGADGMAAAWRPVDGILLDPLVQAGAPCLEGTRVSTQFVLSLVEAGEAPEDIADDYELPLKTIKKALDFEYTLAA